MKYAKLCELKKNSQMKQTNQKDESAPFGFRFGLAWGQQQVAFSSG
jgi:hypothetical protein